MNDKTLLVTIAYPLLPGATHLSQGRRLCSPQHSQQDVIDNTLHRRSLELCRVLAALHQDIPQHGAKLCITLQKRSCTRFSRRNWPDPRCWRNGRLHLGHGRCELGGYQKPEASLPLSATRRYLALPRSARTCIPAMPLPKQQPPLAPRSLKSFVYWLKRRQTPLEVQCLSPA